MVFSFQRQEKEPLQSFTEGAATCSLCETPSAACATASVATTLSTTPSTAWSRASPASWSACMPWRPRGSKKEGFGASHPELKQVVNTGSPGPLIQSCLTHRVLQLSAAPARKCSISLTGHLHPSWLIYQRGWGR